jgi:hypothetical protein
LGFQTTLIKSYFDSSLRLSDLVDDLETTDRLTVRASAAVVRRTDEAIAAEDQVVRVENGRRSRPIVALIADIVETAIAVVANTRSRIPDGGCATEFTREGHAFIGAVVWIATKV